MRYRGELATPCESCHICPPGMDAEQHQERLLINGCLGPVPNQSDQNVQWFDYGGGKHWECVGREIGQDTNDLVRSYANYRNGLLPAQGAMLDQSQGWVNAVAYIDFRMNERDRAERKHK